MLNGINLYGWPAGTMPLDAALAYHMDKGRDFIRIPVDWEVAQPVLGQGLSATLIADIRKFIAKARAIRPGVGVMIDLHNYGRYAKKAIGHKGGPTVWHMGNVWYRIAKALRDVPGLSWGIMNEFHDIADQTVIEATNAAISGIRSAGSDGLIVFGLNHWGNRYGWQPGSSNYVNHQRIFDPLSNCAVDWHCYPDEGSAGQSATPEADPIRYAREFLTWCRQWGVKVFCGEYGFADNPDALKAGAAIVAILDEFADVVIGRCYWAGGGYINVDDVSRLDPYNSSEAANWQPSWKGAPDRPQLAVIAKG